MQQILPSEESVSSCSFFENRHNLIYMYRNFIYISYVCVFTGALLVGCSKREWEKRSNKRLSFLFLIPSSPSVASPSACIPLSPRCVCVLCASDGCTAADCCCCSLAGLDPSDSLVLLLLPLSRAHSSPHSLPLLSFSLSLTQVLWENSRSSMRPSSFPLSDTDILLCMFPIFLAMFFCPSHFQSFIPSFNSIFSVFPHLLGCLSFSLHDAARLC